MPNSHPDVAAGVNNLKKVKQSFLRCHAKRIVPLPHEVGGDARECPFNISVYKNKPSALDYHCLHCRD